MKEEDREPAKEAFVYRYAPYFVRRDDEDVYDFAFGSWMSQELKNIIRRGHALAKRTLPPRYSTGQELRPLGADKFSLPRRTPEWMVEAAN
jgi:hypothetical protein